jgi:serine-type D-Ala-D-Ala carboxypeptidase/endopeptidase (penicillin-binding protein 4)
MKSIRFVLLFLLPLGACAPLMGVRTAPAPQSALAASLDAVFADTALAHAHWGVEVRSLERGEVLYRRDAGRNFVPASNMKLITGATVLEALGPEFRYRTEVLAGGIPQGGVLRGPLVVRGTGDPTLSRRFQEDPRDVFREWADSLRAQGITRVAGGIVGVDSAFVGPTLAPGWAWDDLDAGYSAEFAALQFNENVITVQVVPSRTTGAPAVVILAPATQYLQVNNETVTTVAGTATRILFTRDPGGPGLTIAGTIAADSGLVERTVAVRDPARYFVNVMRETLREQGIAVEGPAILADEWPEAMRRPLEGRLFVHSSPPLREILPAMMKPSQNMIAETLLSTLGLEARGVGSTASGTAAADSILRAWGLDTRNARLVDGSGLSRYNLVSPELLIGLLARMAASPHRDLWHESLPVAGIDGTMTNRLRGSPLEGNLHAKTGTLGGVRALSGYLTTAAGERVVFSTVVNNHARSAATADRVVDAALLEVERGR